MCYQIMMFPSFYNQNWTWQVRRLGCGAPANIIWYLWQRRRESQMLNTVLCLYDFQFHWIVWWQDGLAGKVVTMFSELTSIWSEAKSNYSSLIENKLISSTRRPWNSISLCSLHIINIILSHPTTFVLYTDNNNKI